MELVCKCSVALSQTNRYRIISIEAADIYRQEQENGVAVGIKMPEKNSDACFRMFRNFMDNSLDLIVLEKAYKRICRKKFSFRDKFGNDYTLAVVNVKFNFIHRSENGKTVKIKQLREYFYENGFHIDGIHYVRYKRSAGSSREGKCLFIDERLYKAMAKWSECGLKPKMNLASWESYKALSLSSIKGTVTIPLEGILFVPDYKSTFTDEVISVEVQDGTLTSAHKQTEITNDIWDGESLLDESVFRGNYADKHMLLLRNKFSQSCAFRTKLQKWFQDKNITLKELKSRRNNFLDQKIIRNRDEDTYLYVKGDFEPIISEEQWDRCRQIREQRVRRNKILTENGEKSHLTGVHTSDDVWTKKLRCRCGYRMRRNKWRKNRNGELIYGYKCYASQE